jgi:transcriptional regulator with XRE-family HTH domain
MDKTQEPRPIELKAELAEGRIRAGLGQRIREARQQRGLTTRQLGEVAGLTYAFISQLERGLATPSISSLLRIIYALDITIGDLFDVEQTSPGGVLRRPDWAVFRPLALVEDAVLLSEPDGIFNVVWTRFDVGYESREPVGTHGAATQFVLVLAGEIELGIGPETHVLETHSSIAFDGRIPHTWRNRGSVAAEIVTVATQAAS